MRAPLFLVAGVLPLAVGCSSEPTRQSDLQTDELDMSAINNPTKVAPSTLTTVTRQCTPFESSIRGVSDRIETRPDLVAMRGRWNNAALSTYDKEAMKRAFVLQCEPSVDASNPPRNPENVQVVMSILPEARWTELTTFLGQNEKGPVDLRSFSYTNFLRVVARMPYFCGEPGTFGTIREACQREIASLFAHSAQETGAHDGSKSTPEWKQGFAFLREGNSYDINNSYDPGTPGSPTKCVAPFLCPKTAHYYGRGIKQLTHFYNYAGFSAAFFGDPQVLLLQPDRVAQDGYLAIASGVWFHMSPRPPQPAIHDVLIGNYKPRSAHAGVDVDKFGGVLNRFEATVSIVNGGFECRPPSGSSVAMQSSNRFSYYTSMLKYLDVQLNGVEQSYGKNTVCNIEPGNPWGGAPIIFNPNWYYDTTDGTCLSLTYEPQPALALVVEGVRNVCKTMFPTVKKGTLGTSNPLPF